MLKNLPKKNMSQMNGILRDNIIKSILLLLGQIDANDEFVQK